MPRRLKATITIDTELADDEQVRDTLRDLRKRLLDVEWALRDEYERSWFVWLHETTVTEAAPEEE